MQKSSFEVLEIWEKIKYSLREKVSEEIFSNLFENVKEINHFFNNNVYFIVSTAFNASRITALYLDLINELSNSYSDEIIRFNFVTQEQFDKYTSMFKQTQKETSISSNINPLYTYSRLVIGDFNFSTYHSSTMIADRPYGEINPLFIFGDTGLGKTHFMHAIGNYILSMNPKFKIFYIKASDFRDDYVNHLRNKNLEVFKQSYKDIDILLIDDIQMLAGSDKTQEEFFMIFEKLNTVNKQIVITSDRAPGKLKGMTDRLVSRFQRGVLVEIKHPSFEDRIKIIGEKVKEYEKLKLSGESISYIAQHCYSNIRELEGALNTININNIMYSNNEEVPLEKTKEYLSHLINEKNETNSIDQNNFERVLSVVADFYQISKNDLVGKKRNSNLILPRHIAMYLLKSKYSITFSKIGAIFDGRDHTSVSYAVIQIEDKIKTDSALKLAIKDISSKLV
jgi:chromosomal replication initiator protein